MENKHSEEQLILGVFEITLRMLTEHYKGSDASVALQIFLGAAALKTSSDFESRPIPEDVVGYEYC